MRRETKMDRRLAYYARFAALGFDRATADAIRRIERALSRWAERECGDGSNWAIERDDATGLPYHVYHGDGAGRRYRIADLEKGATKRLAAIMAQHPDCFGYVQGDPRGCMVWVGRKADIPAGGDLDAYYTRGMAAWSFHTH